MAVRGVLVRPPDLGAARAPARIAQAAAPWLFGSLIDRPGTGVLVVTSGFMLAAGAALIWVRPQLDPPP